MVPPPEAVQELPAVLRVLILSGPNLQLLGSREPSIYGSETLEQIHARLGKRGGELGLSVECRQSNHEGALLDWIGAAKGHFAGLILNAGGYSHTSVALRDAILAVGLPTIDVHLSNPYSREPFRHESYLAGACRGRVMGFGGESYLLALEGLARVLRVETR
jgi:3-dehydroquinate dehydratase II